LLMLKRFIGKIPEIMDNWSFAILVTYP